VRVDHHCECRATAPPQRHVAGRPCLRNVDPRCNCIPRRPPACTGTTGSQHRRDHLATGTAPPMSSQDQLNPRHQAAGRPRHTGPVRRYRGCLRRPKEARLALHGPSPAIPETCWARPTAQPETWPKAASQCGPATSERSPERSPGQTNPRTGRSVPLGYAELLTHRQRILGRRDLAGSQYTATLTNCDHSGQGH
jgi:hypothetical protein